MSNEKKPLITHLFTADPSAHVYNNRIYLYPSHDIPHDGIDDDEGIEYQMVDYHVFSASDVDGEWTDHGEALHMKNVPWVKQQMWAPDAVYKNGKYYLCFPAKDHNDVFHIGMAISDCPEGPFIPEAEPLEGSKSIDPAVFVDDDGKVYLYNGGLWGGQMEKWISGHFDPNTKGPAGDEPALGPYCGELTEDLLSYKTEPKQLQIIDEEGKNITAGDEDRRFFEGPWMHKYQGKYYLSYSTGTTHYIVYAVADNPMGPFVFKGKILEPVLGWTTHHSIVEYQGKWYLFYHDCEISKGINHRRNVKYAELQYDEDGTIHTVIP